MSVMSRASRALIRLWLAVFVLLGSGVGTLATAPRAAAASAPGVSLTVHSMNPRTLTDNKDLQVTVTVRNNGSADLAGATATLAVGTEALDSVSAQQRWETAKGHLATKTATTQVPDLAPGASSDVVLTLPASSIDVGYSMTTLPVEIQVKGNAGGSAVAATAHETTPWTSNAGSIKPMSAQLIVPITLPADPQLFSSTGATRFRAWNKAMGPGSAIDKLLSSTPSVPVTWLVDPTVLDPPTAQDGSLPSTATLAGDGTENPGSGTSSTSTPSGGAGSSNSSVPSNSGSSSPTSSSTTKSSPTTNQSLTTVDDLAARLRARLHDRASSEQVWFTPYGDPDLSTLTAAHRPKGADALLRRMLGRTLPASLQEISTTVVAAPAAPLDAGSTQRLSSAWHDTRHGYPTIITPNATLDGNSSSTVTSSNRRDAAGHLLLGVNSVLSRALSDTSITDSQAGIQARSRSLALYQEQPSTSRSLVAMASRATIAPTRLQEVASALESSSWVAPTTIDLAAASSAARPGIIPEKAAGSQDVWPVPSSGALSSADISTTNSTLTNLGRYAGIVADGSDIVPAWGRSLDQVAATRWRGRGELIHELVRTTEETVDSVPGRVSVLPSGTINFFTDSGNITVTVRNDLARTVNGVKLHLVPRSYAVRFTTAPDAVNVEAGSRAGIRVPTVAQAAGSVVVLARIEARNGIELGHGSREPVAFTINARPTGTWIYWALGIVALLVFCYGLARNRKKGTRRRDELARDIQL